MTMTEEIRDHVAEADLRNRLADRAGVPLRMLENPWLLRADPAMLAHYGRVLPAVETLMEEVATLEEYAPKSNIEAVQGQLATIQRQLGTLDRIENTLGEIHSVLRDIRGKGRDE